MVDVLSRRVYTVEVYFGLSVCVCVCVCVCEIHSYLSEVVEE